MTTQIQAATLAEQYRPTDWSDVVGQPKAVTALLRLRDRDAMAGRAYWLSGPSGTGKTTIARLIAAEVAEDWLTEELDASDLTPARLRAIEETMQLHGWGRGGRAFIVNEAHGLRRDTVRQLLVLLERLPSHVVMIFTTTNQGQDALFEGCEDGAPLLSRCMAFKLTNQGLAQGFAERARMIAQAEGLDGRPTAAYLQLVRECKNNMRQVLQRIEVGDMLAA